MRRKKKIIVYCCNEDQLSITSFILGTKCRATRDNTSLKYEITRMATLRDIHQCNPTEFEGAVIIRSDIADDTAIEAAILISDVVPVVFVDNKEGCAHWGINVSGYLTHKAVPEQWVEWIDRLTKRKRGPKKGPRYQEMVAVAA